MTAAAELAKLVRKTIEESLTISAVELLITALVWSRICPLAWILTQTHSRLDLPHWIPPFYIPLAVISLLVIVAYLGIFIVTFPHQEYEIRPVFSVILFVVTSLVSTVILFATLYRWTGIVRPEFPAFPPYYNTSESVTTQNIWECIYFSIITITTVGYGDYHPTNIPSSRTIACLEALLGYIILGLLVSTLSVMVRPRRDILGNLNSADHNADSGPSGAVE